MSLADGFKEQDGCAHGDIEAVQPPQHRDADVGIGGFTPGLGETGRFGAQDERGASPHVGIVIQLRLLQLGGEDADAAGFEPGDHGTTFGGNPLACAAGLAVIDVLTEQGFLDEVRAKGEYIRSTVRGWNLPCVKDVRGKGLMIGIDIAQSAAAVQKQCLANGLCSSTAGANTLRFLPPLVITREEIDKGLAVLKSVLAA